MKSSTMRSGAPERGNNNEDSRCPAAQIPRFESGIDDEIPGQCGGGERRGRKDSVEQPQNSLRNEAASAAASSRRAWRSQQARSRKTTYPKWVRMRSPDRRCPAPAGQMRFDRPKGQPIRCGGRRTRSNRQGSIRQGAGFQIRDWRRYHPQVQRRRVSR